MRSGKSRPAPIGGAHLQTGFPSPADDYLEASLDLHSHLIHNEISTFYFRMGEDAPAFELHAEDLLIVDRSLQPQPGHLVLAAPHGEFCIFRLERSRGCLQLRSAHNHILQEDFELRGVITFVVRSLYSPA